MSRKRKDRSHTYAIPGTRQPKNAFRAPNACPRCKAPLVLRINRAAGTTFLGCSTWHTTKCNGAINIPQIREPRPT